jgi:hypothetical protein
MSKARWLPLGTVGRNRPAAGQLLAHKHTVWRVIRVEDIELTDKDRDTWINFGAPDLTTWGGRPYRITVHWAGGVKPDWAEREDGDFTSLREGHLDVPAGSYKMWNVYPGGRWPQCSCCSEPMPCRAELEDREVTRSLDRVAELEAIPPGACWACQEPITTRQKTVTYPGENLDLPGGQQPHFHARKECAHSARDYEERWLAVDPRRERILTWPQCGGTLIVHADGSSECVVGRDVLGQQHEPQPDCRGHLTHDHGHQRSCGGCDRGCVGGHGIRLSPRPDRRQPSSERLFQ